MPEFLKLTAPDEALKRFMSHLPAAQPRRETLPVLEAAGRVLASDVYALEALPSFRRSTVDGFAVQASSTFGASDSLPIYMNVVGESQMGAEPNFKVGKGQAAVIHTGGMLPEGANAVVMMEYTQEARAGEVEVQRAVSVGENVIEPGEDVKPGELLLEAGKELSPAVVGGLMSQGIAEVEVVKPPRIGILSSGDEVVDPLQVPLPGQVRDVNSYSLSALVQRFGGEPVRFGISSDREEDMRARARSAMDACDALVITAGSSASVRDLTARILAEMGEPGVLVHGIRIRPGKPTILAVCDGKPAIGLPGNPVSALVVGSLFIKPMIYHLTGRKTTVPVAYLQARLSTNTPSQAGKEEWFPVSLRQDERGWIAEPIFYKSNLIFALAKADGLIRVPLDANGLEAGQVVEVYFL
ncbi:molybdenum cofactor biosynthesis protein [Ornatilinea apprima]|uniref:Molybdopterin molybdenumtransferase n=1 Tax=Ornatilinea apprima TaxID=1134406 RepID=A0A0P6YF83_9CHLR|nr:gephyrin-like molybdotransferase Glp [Ornatilinea apprima]KPL80825.1 molybdenum cofactor biosynthesis protein [Ornatilinea apprima]